MPDTSEHTRKPPARPSERVFNVRERARQLRCLGEHLEKLSHEVAASVVEPGDLIGFGHPIVGVMLKGSTPAFDARHPAYGTTTDA